MKRRGELLTRAAAITTLASLLIACGDGAAVPAQSSGGGGNGTAASSGMTTGGNASSTAASSGTSGTGGGGTACGNTPRNTAFEGRPRACVSNGQCAALTTHGTYAPTGKPPTLPLGVLTDLGPPVGPLEDGAGDAVAMTFDPSHTATLYVGFEFHNGGSPKNGLWKSTDGGSTWAVLGTGSDDNPYDCTSNYLDLPIRVEVDPNDSNHLYVTEGVRGAGNGFWVSWDGGSTWIRAYSGDLTAMSVDPCDFCHVIVGSHEFTPVGVLETMDGGYSWVQHPPQADWEGGSYGVNFLYDPKSHQGDSKTWLVQNGHMRRTTDAGETWTIVSDVSGIHGFTTLYYASNGAVYSGSGQAPVRSVDNGITWTLSSAGLTSAPYYGIIGDGTNLYALPDGYPPPLPLMTTPESDGMHWKQYGSGQGQKSQRAMQHPHYDPNSGIVYFVDNVTLQAVRVKAP